MPVPGGMYQQQGQGPSCVDRMKMGFFLGFCVGIASGAMFGGFSALRCDVFLGFAQRYSVLVVQQTLEDFKTSHENIQAKNIELEICFIRSMKWFQNSWYSLLKSCIFTLFGSSPVSLFVKDVDPRKRLFEGGLRGKELVNTVGKVMLQGGGSFGTFLAIGSGLRC